MNTKRDTTDYKSFEVQLSQGVRSRYAKSCNSLDAADECLPSNAMGGSSADIRQCLAHIQTAQTNLVELLVYRKIMGID